MGKRLILFSGGVESTAMLTQAKHEDILVTVSKTYRNYALGYNQTSIEYIASYYNKKIQYTEINIPVDTNSFVHQMWYLQAVATLWVVKDQDITEVWCGRHSTDLEKPELRSFIDKMMSIWDYTHPNVPFNHPLDHLTKLEQWNLIPNEIKQYVSSCSTGLRCGNCYKCKEFLELVGDF